MLSTQVEYNLLFAPMSKRLLVDKGNKVKNLLHLFVVLNKTLPASLQVQELYWPFDFMPGHYRAVLISLPR